MIGGKPLRGCPSRQWVLESGTEGSEARGGGRRVRSGVDERVRGRDDVRRAGAREGD